MAAKGISTPADIAITGLRAQRMRMRVIANNIANAGTSRTQAGKPYRRRDVVLQTSGEVLSGVRIADVGEDLSTALKRVRDPDNPQADADGFVTLSNVELPQEMVHLVMASRAYQANAAVLKRYQESVNTALELLR